MISILYIMNNDANGSSGVKLSPVKEYAPGETYILWIKNVKGKNGLTLKKNDKMEFTTEKGLGVSTTLNAKGNK